MDNTSQTLHRLVHDGTRSLDREDFTSAAASFAQIVALAPSIHTGYLHAGALLARQGRIGEAIAKLERAAALAPQNFHAQYGLGEALRRAGQPEGALFAFRAAAAASPLDPGPVLRQGSILLGLKRLHEASETLRTATTACAMPVGTPDQRLACQEASTELARAEALQIAEYSRQHRLLVRRSSRGTDGLSKNAASLSEEALALRNAFDRHPDDEGAAHRYANLLIDDGRLEEAAAFLEPQVAVPELQRPRGWTVDGVRGALNALGVAYEGLGFFDEAVTVLEMAMRLEPRDARGSNATIESAIERRNTQVMLAHVFRQKNRDAEAEAHFRAAGLKRPSVPGPC